MCQKRYEFQYIERIKTPVSLDLIRGDAYHKAIAHAYTNIVIYKEKPGIDEVLDVYSDTWNKRLTDRIIIDEGEEIEIPAVDFKGKDPGKMKNEGSQLVKIYYNTIMPRVFPAEVEVRKTAIYEGIPLVAYIDLIEWDGTVDEHKIKAKLFSEAELTKDLQSSVYGIILNRDELKFNYHIALAVKEPYIKIVPVRRTREDMDWAGKLIVNAWRQIESGLFSPCISGWWCAPNQCQYWGYCRMPRDF